MKTKIQNEKLLRTDRALYFHYRRVGFRSRHAIRMARGAVDWDQINLSEGVVWWHGRGMGGLK